MIWKASLAVATILFSGTLYAQTINITCLTANGGFYIDWENWTVLTQGESADFAVQPQGSTVQLWSRGGTCRYRSYDVLPGSVWNIFNEGAESQRKLQILREDLGGQPRLRLDNPGLDFDLIDQLYEEALDFGELADVEGD